MKKKFGGIALMVLLGGIAFCNAQDYQDYSSSVAEVTDFDVETAMTDMETLKNSLDGVIKQLYALDAQERGSGNVISANYRTTRNEIVNVIQTINQTTDDISEQLKKIATYKKLMVMTYQEIQSSRSGMVDTKEYIQNLTTFMYKLDNRLYNTETDNIDDIKLLINSDNVAITLANDQFVQSLLTQLGELMGDFQENESQQLETIKKLNSLKSQAKASIEQYQIEIEKLQQKKNYLLQFMDLYQGDDTKREMSIDNFFESTKSVYEKTKEFVKEIKKGVYKVDFDVDKKLKSLQKIEDDQEIYPLARPIYPIEKIMTYFGDITFQKQYGIPQIGIQIAAKQKTPVYAARDGIVYFVADNDEIGINRTMIMHTDGYVTVYQYLNSNVVSPGDIVRRGQLIGYSGGEPGTRGAGFISKGANLTFSIFKDGIAMDPFEILDASIVKDKNVLPEGYQIKYLRDKYARAIDITDLELMTGNTLEQREKQFLTRYGVGVYRDISFRENAVKGTNIDKDVVACIAFAESTLGRYLSTSNNIGNVGNNDRGDRVGFSSAYVGARAIAVTLNNTALGGYHTINQLSRYGNKDGMIYASSPINRQTNVLKCLSQIKGYYIPEDFPFRTGPNPNKNNPIPETVEFGESLTK